MKTILITLIIIFILLILLFIFSACKVASIADRKIEEYSKDNQINKS